MQVRVAAISGFIDVVIPGGNVAPQPVSIAYPLPITIGTGSSAVSASVIGYIPDNAADTNGPGTLMLSAAVGAAFPLRTTVTSAYAPTVVRSAPGNSVDAIGAADSITLQQCINAVAFLRRANVLPHDDGFYHAHISALGNAQFFADPVFQRLNQSLPEHIIYKEGFIGTIAGIMFFINNEAPEEYNTGTLTQTANLGLYASELGAEVQNGAGVAIGRCLITGKGSVYERYMDESQYVTEAGNARQDWRVQRRQLGHPDSHGAHPPHPARPDGQAPAGGRRPRGPSPRASPSRATSPRRVVLKDSSVPWFWNSQRDKNPLILSNHHGT